MPTHPFPTRRSSNLIDVSRHAIDFHHFGHARQRLGETLQPLGGMIAGLDLHENRQAKPDRLRIENGDTALDHAVALQPLDRSEEHTSELQSLMRTSDAVFCLKKKKT